MNQGLRAAIEAAGSKYRLAQLLGVHPSSIIKWHRIPSARIIQVEKVTGVDRAVLRPDLYRREEKAK